MNQLTRPLYLPVLLRTNAGARACLAGALLASACASSTSVSGSAGAGGDDGSAVGDCQVADFACARLDGAAPLAELGVVAQRVYIGADQVEETDLAQDETSPLGFSAGDVLDAFEGAHVNAFTYCDESAATELTVTITDRGGPYVFRDWETYDEEDGLVFPVDLMLRTADGVFNEEAVSSFHVRGAMKAYVVSEPKVADLGGTYAYPTPDGAIRGPGSVQMLVRLSPECGAYGRFTLINAAPYHDAWFDVGRF